MRRNCWLLKDAATIVHNCLVILFNHFSTQVSTVTFNRITFSLIMRKTWANNSLYWRKRNAELSKYHSCSGAALAISSNTQQSRTHDWLSGSECAWKKMFSGSRSGGWPDISEIQCTSISIASGFDIKTVNSAQAVRHIRDMYPRDSRTCPRALLTAETHRYAHVVAP